MRLLQLTLGALEELHTQLQLSFVEGEKEVCGCSLRSE